MEIIKTGNKKTNRKPRVAAYARVSTGKEKQVSSYRGQVEYYDALIKSNPNWKFAGVYSDLGKSGLSAEKRPGFLQMIEDAKAGNIDVILVKSISRFARNCLEAQQYVHILKEYGVEVRFAREMLSTFDPHSEMVFNFLTAVAEEQSRSISENTVWSLKKLAEKGIRHIGSNRVLGYDEIDGALTPNEQAWIPKLIFTLYAEGKTYVEIADELEEKEAVRLRSNGRFTPSQIQRILRNEIYVGDRRIQKQPHIDFKTKKPKWGEEYESFYVQDDHESIVSREIWDTAQRRLDETKDQRDNGIYRKHGSHFLFGRIFCGECGEPMIRRVDKSNGNDTATWTCKDRRKGKKGNGCKNLIISEEELLEVLTEALGHEWNGAENVAEETFDALKVARLYEDGNLNIELRGEIKTA